MKILFLFGVITKKKFFLQSATFPKEIPQGKLKDQTLGPKTSYTKHTKKHFKLQHKGSTACFLGTFEIFLQILP